LHIDFSPTFSLTFQLNILKLETSAISMATSSALDLAKALNARLRTQTNLTFSQDKLTFKPPTEPATRDALIGHLTLKKNLRLQRPLLLHRPHQRSRRPGPSPQRPHRHRLMGQHDQNLGIHERASGVDADGPYGRSLRPRCDAGSRRRGAASERLLGRERPGLAGGKWPLEADV